jgi:hypothetical protein
MPDTVAPEQALRERDAILEDIRALVSEVRGSSLWFLNAAFQPMGEEEALRALRWMLREASSIIDALPFQEIGKCVLSSQGGLFQGSGEDAARALSAGEVVFHSGSIRGAMPSFVAG